MGTDPFNLTSLTSSFAGLLKVFEIVIALLFIVYSLFVLKEVSMMNKALASQLAPRLKSIAHLQLLIGIAAVVVLLLILLI